MSRVFRELLKKIGSGEHTHQDLSRDEACLALKLMLTQEATPAQIGAFLIAHRIKRPTPAELAGMLDAYDELGPKLAPIDSPYPVVVLSQPYDGRDRTVPLSPVTALVLSSVGIPVLQHGGERMPTKEGTPLVDVWDGLGINWRVLSLAGVQQLLQQGGLGFVYVPRHFPLAYGLVPYREQIGKRPPIATLELVWCPYAGVVQLVAGYVHPPTETIMAAALQMRGLAHFVTVKGLEGSCDLPRDRTPIVTVYHQQTPERLRLNPAHYGLYGGNPRWVDLESAIKAMQQVLQGEANELHASVVWNSGFYLWQTGYVPDLESGLTHAQELLRSGQVYHHLQKLQQLAASLC
ncbi:MAG: anthranilate phosphoribosyltransferase family protein [Gloeomargarita sp. SKYG116]|nr:anthranilate phosphoribosyltransferase family protein [Gloeomargarita sp. SKYG116]MDW8401922.1 anthranilate phosphoribosyltransferase family protein [Gloeomargarita sp. SKYGB_i_bin116]